MHTEKPMRNILATGAAGSAGIFASITLGHINILIGMACGLMTLAAMTPVALSRWETYLEKRRNKKSKLTVETSNPFEDEK